MNSDDDKRLPRMLATLIIAVSFALFAAAIMGWLGPIAP